MIDEKEGNYPAVKMSPNKIISGKTSPEAHNYSSSENIKPAVPAEVRSDVVEHLSPLSKRALEFLVSEGKMVIVGDES